MNALTEKVSFIILPQMKNVVGSLVFAPSEANLVREMLDSQSDRVTARSSFMVWLISLALAKWSEFEQVGALQIDK